MSQKGLKTHLENLAGYTMASPGSGTGVIYQSDWDETNEASPAFIQHKPSIAGSATWGTETADHYAPLTDSVNVTKTVALQDHTHTLSQITDYEIDDAPTQNSDNPVKSNGILAALNQKQDTLQYDTTPTPDSSKMLTSGSIYNAIQAIELSDAAMHFNAPSLQIKRRVRISDGAVATPGFVIRHPLLTLDNGVRLVLMRWHPRRTRPSYSGYDTYRTGWGEAKGGIATVLAPNWYNAAGTQQDAIWVSMEEVRQWIINHYICCFDRSESYCRSMTLATFRADGANPYRFGAQFSDTSHSPAWTRADWKAHTKPSWLFGFAVRYPNPAFTAAETGLGIDDTTRQIEDPDHPGLCGLV